MSNTTKINQALIILALLFAIIVGKVYAQSLTVYEIGGTIRPSSNGQWYVLSDSQHVPINLSTQQVYMGSDYMRVYFADTLTHINWSSINADETLSIWGYDCGGSVNMNYVDIYCGRNGQVVDMRTVTGSTANIWIYVRGEK